MKEKIKPYQATKNFAEALKLLSSDHDRSVMQNWFNNHVQSVITEVEIEKNVPRENTEHYIKHKMMAAVADSLVEMVDIERSEPWENLLYGDTQERHTVRLIILK